MEKWPSGITFKLLLIQNNFNIFGFMTMRLIEYKSRTFINMYFYRMFVENVEEHQNIFPVTNF